MRINLLALFSVSLLLTQCRDLIPSPKPPPITPATLPPETQTGAGTLGCIVNGQVISIFSSFLTPAEWSSAVTLRIVGQTSAPQPEYAMQLVLHGNLADGQLFYLTAFGNKFSTTSNEFVADASTDRFSCVYSGKQVKTGKVELVKFDGVARIASGRFAFTLYEPGGCDTLRITNGRFDVKF